MLLVVPLHILPNLSLICMPRVFWQLTLFFGYSSLSGCLNPYTHSNPLYALSIKFGLEGAKRVTTPLAWVLNLFADDGIPLSGPTLYRMWLVLYNSLL